MSALIDNARIFAMAAHDTIGHVRRYTGEPYWKHCEEVVAILQEHGDRTPFSRCEWNQMVAAAWLHDTVEDTPVTSDEIGRVFGRTIQGLVEGLTDVSRPSDGNRAKRKEIDRLHTALAPRGAQIVKLADLISNTRSIVAHDPQFAVTYLAEKQLLLEVLQGADDVLWTIAKSLADRGLHTIEQNRLDNWFVSRGDRTIPHT